MGVLICLIFDLVFNLDLTGVLPQSWSLYNALSAA